MGKKKLESEKKEIKIVAREGGGDTGGTLQHSGFPLTWGKEISRRLPEMERMGASP